VLDLYRYFIYNGYKGKEVREMPCYITYRGYTTISEKDFTSFMGAVRSLGYQTTSYGSVIDLDNGRAKLRQVPGGYELSGDRSFSKKLMEEHEIRKIEKEVRMSGQRSKRETSSNGKLQLRVMV